jgi:hypothetical protein
VPVSLRLRHLVWIAAAATIGLVVGFVLITNLRSESPATQTGRLGPTTTQSATPAANAAEQKDGLTVPNLVGQRLPAAEAMLTGAKFRNYQELDVDGRLIIDKDNWVVDSQDPAAGEVVPPDTRVVMRVRKPTDGSVPTAAGPGVVPNVVCAELQAAQEALRGSGFLLLTSKDGTGQGRVPLLDRNWVVIAQSEAPGSKPSTTTLITLTVVKHGEPSGTSGCAT